MSSNTELEKINGSQSNLNIVSSTSAETLNTTTPIDVIVQQKQQQHHPIQDKVNVYIDQIPSILDVVPTSAASVAGTVPSSPSHQDVVISPVSTKSLAPLVEPESSGTPNPAATPTSGQPKLQSSTITTMVASSSSKLNINEEPTKIPSQTNIVEAVAREDDQQVPPSQLDLIPSSPSSQYKSAIQPRHTVISRRVASPHSSQMQLQTSGGRIMMGSPIQMKGALSQQNLVGQVFKETRHKEKQELSELNDRFAGYVERVRFLEAQNKKLQLELGILKGKWGQETKQIEKMYQVELDEARSVLNDTSKTKDTIQLKLDRSEQELDAVRRKYAELDAYLNEDKAKIVDLLEQIASNESELGLLRRRLQDLQDEEKRYKQESQRVMSEIQRVQFELENEMKQRLMLENDKQSLEEELLFLREVHAKELEEMKNLALHEAGFDPSLFFKSELSNAIKEIREEYETLNQTQRNELEAWYRLKINEIQRKNAITSAESSDALNREQARKLKMQMNDTKRNVFELKAKNAELESRIKDLEEEIKREENESSTLIQCKENEISALKENLNKIVNEYDDLMNTKSDLEVEIRTYRKLLEGEENRDGLKQIVETIEHRSRGYSSNPARNVASSSSYAITSASAGGYTAASTERETSPFKKSTTLSTSTATEKPSKKDCSPRRFASFLTSSRSHHDQIEKHAALNRIAESGLASTDVAPTLTFRRSCLIETAGDLTTADDSSAAEDNDEKSRSRSKKRANTLPKREVYGEIELDILYDSAESKLKITVLQARLHNSQEVSSLVSADSYARILLLPDRKKKSKKKTKIVKDSMTPQWTNETFDYEISLDEARSKFLDVLVKNGRPHSLIFNRERSAFLGECLINLADHLTTNESPRYIGWFTLKDRSFFENDLKKLENE